MNSRETKRSFLDIDHQPKAKLKSRVTQMYITNYLVKFSDQYSALRNGVKSILFKIGTTWHWGIWVIFYIDIDSIYIYLFIFVLTYHIIKSTTK